MSTGHRSVRSGDDEGHHKTSTLQDVEFGRSMEVEALIGAILELGQLTDTPSPSVAAVYALVKLLNRTMPLEGAGVRIGQAA